MRGKCATLNGGVQRLLPAPEGLPGFIVPQDFLFRPARRHVTARGLHQSHGAASQLPGLPVRSPHGRHRARVHGQGRKPAQPDRPQWRISRSAIQPCAARFGTAQTRSAMMMAKRSVSHCSVMPSEGPACCSTMTRMAMISATHDLLYSPIARLPHLYLARTTNSPCPSLPTRSRALHRG